MDINNLIVWVWTACGLLGIGLCEYLRSQYAVDMRVAGLPAMDPIGPDIIAARKRLLLLLEPIALVIMVIGLFILARIYRDITPAWVDWVVDEWVLEVFRWGMLLIAILVLGAIGTLTYNSRELIRKARAVRLGKTGDV